MPAGLGSSNYKWLCKASQRKQSPPEASETIYRLLFQLTNFGQPIIEIVDANHANRGELYLVHRHEGIDLDVPYATATLENLHTVWGRSVHIETVVTGEGKFLLSHGPDGGKKQKI